MSRALKGSRTSEERERLATEVRRAYAEIIDFVTTAEFKRVHDELMSLPGEERPTFVRDVMLNDLELEERGVRRPSDLLIQRSAFGDRRPTLYCVKKWLPRDLRMFWENVNITFDNEYEDETIPRDATAWRAPLPVPVQHAVLSGELSSSGADAVMGALDPALRLGL